MSNITNKHNHHIKVYDVADDLISTVYLADPVKNVDDEEKAFDRVERYLRDNGLWNDSLMMVIHFK